jgi:hypothetical protein
LASVIKRYGVRRFDVDMAGYEPKGLF